MRRNHSETASSVSPANDAESMSIPDFRTIDSSSLNGSTYKGEGNATLVVSLPRERKVLRLRKLVPNGGDETAEDSGKSRVELIVDFHKNIISGLMGRFACEPEIVRIDPEELSRWTRVFEAHRPGIIILRCLGKRDIEHRRHKKLIETFATALPDYTILPGHLEDKVRSDEKIATFCVEIKPKQGFVNTETSLYSAKCDYCRKQCVKVAAGKISKPSDYCPLDLFSGQDDRMRRAVAGLARSPQNNFRIFKNGELVYGEGFETDDIEDPLKEWLFDSETFDKEGALATMFELIREALLRPFLDDRPTSLSSDSSTISLPRHSVLERILRVQTLNNHSLDYVYRIYSTYSEILNDEMIYKKLNSANHKETPTSVPSVEELMVLRNYLLHRIAKDCSIMMAFREIDASSTSSLPSESVIRISSSRCYLFNTAVTDLDPKSVYSIEKHHHQKQSENLTVAAPS